MLGCLGDTHAVQDVIDGGSIMRHHIKHAFEFDEGLPLSLQPPSCLVSHFVKLLLLLFNLLQPFAVFVTVDADFDSIRKNGLRKFHASLFTHTTLTWVVIASPVGPRASSTANWTVNFHPIA